MGSGACICWGHTLAICLLVLSTSYVLSGVFAQGYVFLGLTGVAAEGGEEVGCGQTGACSGAQGTAQAVPPGDPHLLPGNCIGCTAKNCIG